MDADRPLDPLDDRPFMGLSGDAPEIEPYLIKRGKVRNVYSLQLRTPKPEEPRIRLALADAENAKGVRGDDGDGD